jgi:isopenicillin N synthase-like dioxygenase
LVKYPYPSLVNRSQYRLMEPVKLTLPIISIAPYILNTGTEQERLVTAKALHDACKTYGFFYLSLDGIADRHTTDKLETLARQFFALPQEQKDQISLSNQDGARGVFHTPHSYFVFPKCPFSRILRISTTEGKCHWRKG